MGCSVETFKPSHLEGFEPQAEQWEYYEALKQFTAVHWQNLSRQGPIRAVIIDGKTVAIGGLINQWHGRSTVWAILGDGLKRSHLLCVHRAIAAFLDDHQRSPSNCRLEATVVEGLEQGHRWMRMLGFSAEAWMPCYDPAGNTHCLYSRISNVTTSGGPGSGGNFREHRRVSGEAIPTEDGSPERRIL